jgi:hypothetical protein
MRYPIILASVVLIGSACSKTDSGAPEKPAKPAAGSAIEAPHVEGVDNKPSEDKSGTAKIAPAKIEKLKLQLDLPGEAEITWNETLGTEINANGIQRMYVIDAVSSMSLDKKKSSIAVMKPQNIKSEKLPDGWWITFESTVGDHAYVVELQRTFESKSYLCGLIAFTPEEQAAVLAACRTLRR